MEMSPMGIGEPCGGVWCGAPYVAWVPCPPTWGLNIQGVRAAGVHLNLPDPVCHRVIYDSPRTMNVMGFIPMMPGHKGAGGMVTADETAFNPPDPSPVTCSPAQPSHSARPRRIYLATPYSHPLEAKREIRYIQAALALEAVMRGEMSKTGFAPLVYSPILHSHPLTRLGMPTEFEAWEALDLAMIDWADVVVVIQMDGWDQSAGIKAEVEYAESHGKPVVVLPDRSPPDRVIRFAMDQAAAAESVISRLNGRGKVAEEQLQETDLVRKVREASEKIASDMNREVDRRVKEILEADRGQMGGANQVSPAELARQERLGQCEKFAGLMAGLLGNEPTPRTWDQFERLFARAKEAYEPTRRAIDWKALTLEKLLQALKELAVRVHANARAKGWYPEGSKPDLASHLINIQSEGVEAWEEYRNGHDVREIYLGDGGKPEGIPVELADVLIRVLDTCEAFGVPLVAAMEKKIGFNATRPERHGGKLA